MRKWINAALLSAFVNLGCTPAAPDPAVPAPPAPPAPPVATHAAERAKATNFTLDHGALVLPAPIAFETDGTAPVAESEASLHFVVDYLEAKPDITLMRVEVHTDNDGANNDELSEKRAMAVARWLVSHGVKCQRIAPVGFGATKPIAGSMTHQTPEEKAQNRRVLFVNAALRGRSIGGMPIDGGGHIAGDTCN